MRARPPCQPAPPTVCNPARTAVRLYVFMSFAEVQTAFTHRATVKLKPYQPTHPGEVLKDELEYRGISQRGLAKEIGISYSAFNEMLNGKRSLSPELAMMMEAALGVDAAPLLAMQNEYDMLMAERNDSFMEKLKQIRRIAAIF